MTQNLEAYTDALFKLTAKENPTSDEEETIELLTWLVERYEDEHYPVPASPHPVSVVAVPHRKGASHATRFDSSIRFGICGIHVSLRAPEPTRLGNSAPASNSVLMPLSPAPWQQEQGATKKSRNCSPTYLESGGEMQSFREYPPRSKPGSFSLDQALPKMQQPSNN